MYVLMLCYVLWQYVKKLIKIFTIYDMIFYIHKLNEEI